MKKQLITVVLTVAVCLTACGQTASTGAKTSSQALASGSSLSSTGSTVSEMPAADSESSEAVEEISSAPEKETSSAVSEASVPDFESSSEDWEISDEDFSETNDASEDVSTEASEETDTVLSFDAQDLEGNSVTDAIFANAKLTFVNVWGTFCGPCIAEMPGLGELAKELESEGVQFLGVVCDVADFDGSFYPGQLEEAKNIVETTGADYTHIILTADFDKLLSGAYMVPTTYFVDSKGQILGDSYIGSRAKEDWQSIITEKLAGL